MTMVTDHQPVVNDQSLITNYWSVITTMFFTFRLSVHYQMYPLPPVTLKWASQNCWYLHRLFYITHKMPENYFGWNQYCWFGRDLKFLCSELFQTLHYHLCLHRNSSWYFTHSLKQKQNNIVPAKNHNF